MHSQRYIQPVHSDLERAEQRGLVGSAVFYRERLPVTCGTDSIRGTSSTRLWQQSAAAVKAPDRVSSIRTLSAVSSSSEERSSQQRG